MDFIKNLFFEISIQDIISIASFFAVVIGGCFALYQWSRNSIYKRAEIVERLIVTVRDDEDISTILDIIDWNSGLHYDGNFHLEGIANRKALFDISDEDLFKKIDKTLAHFSYICYLKYQRALTKKDMRNFEYEIRRLVDNENIANYLYSLHHWSKSLNVKMSFSFLIDYCLDKKYISSDFKSLKSEKYVQFLSLSNAYKDKLYI